MSQSNITAGWKTPYMLWIQGRNRSLWDWSVAKVMGLELLQPGDRGKGEGSWEGLDNRSSDVGKGQEV